MFLMSPCPITFDKKWKHDLLVCICILSTFTYVSSSRRHQPPPRWMSPPIFLVSVPLPPSPTPPRRHPPPPSPPCPSLPHNGGGGGWLGWEFFISGWGGVGVRFVFCLGVDSISYASACMCSGCSRELRPRPIPYRALAACHMHANTYLLTQRAMNAMCQKWCYLKVAWHERVLCNHRFVHYAYTLGLCQRHTCMLHKYSICTRFQGMHDASLALAQCKHFKGIVNWRSH